MFNLLALIAWCWVTPTRAQETTDQIVLSELTYDDVAEAYRFTVSLEGSRIYTAYNMDIFLPEGISVVFENNKYKVSMLKTTKAVYPYSTSEEWDDDSGDYKEVKTYSHTLSASMPTERQLRVACSSQANDDFTKTSGDLFRVYVTVDASTLNLFSPKPLVKVSGIALAQADATQQTPADFSCRPFSTGIPTERELPINISASNQVGTLILPFDAALPEGVKAYTCNGADGEQTLTLEAATSFEACKPYIVYAASGYSGIISGTVDLSTTYPDEDIYTEGYLTGVLSTTVVNTGYILQNQGEGPTFYAAEGSNFMLSAGRCYLTPSSPLSAKALHLSFEEADGIDGVQTTTTPDVYHDLSGRRVIQPTKGIYIQDRKKVLVK